MKISKTKSRRLLMLYVVLLSLFFAGSVEAATGVEVSPPKAQVIYPVKHDRSKISLRAIPFSVVQGSVNKVVPLYPLPYRKRIDEPVQTLAPVQQESPVQEMVPVPALPMPSPLLSFEGTNNVNGVAPPDTCGDVGLNHYVQAVNLSYQIFDKLGNSLYGPAPLNTLWTGFGGICESHNNGDPVVLYDQWADRWLISQFALDYGGAGFHQCIAVSKTGDPTGEWNRYDYKMSDTIMNDYPKFGIWPDGYYMSINQFNAASGYSWAGQGVAVFDRTAMLAGDIAVMQYMDLNTALPDLSAMLPSDADGMTQPAPGESNHFVMFTDDIWGSGFTDQLVLYDFHVDWANSANTTFLPVAALDTEPLSWFPGSIDQPDTTVKVASLGDRLMYRLQYRNFGDHESMVVNHTVDSGSGVAGIRWYELRNEGTGWMLYQQGTHAPDGSHRWMASIAMDQQGNIAAGYSVSNSTDVYPSIRYAGRLAGDLLNTFSQTETELHTGTGSQTESSYSRWGDYSMMSVDPVDDCTFWYTQEYMETTSAWGWQTRIGAFKFPSCSNGPVGSLSGRVEDDAGNPVAGVLIRLDDNGGSIWSTVTDINGSYFFAAVPDISPATYTVTATKYAYAEQVVTGVSLVTGINTVLDFVIELLPVHNLSGTVTDAATSWPLYARIDYGNGSVWTDPLTGGYSVDLPEGSIDLIVTGYAAGYDPAARSILLIADQAEDFFLVVDPAICDAPGYGFADLTTCMAPTAGGLVFGNVYDENTGTPLNNVRISNGADHSATSVPTPDDDSIADGFYSLYVPSSGLNDLTASLDKPQGYGVDLRTVSIPILGSIEQDFFLPAGYLRAIPDSVEIFIAPDGVTSLNLLLDNVGGVSGSFKFFEVNEPLPIPVNGPFADRTRHMSPKHLEDSDPDFARYDYPGLASVPVVNAPGDVLKNWLSGLVFPWGTGFDKSTDTVWLGNVTAGGGDDINYEFSPTGNPTGRTLDVSPIPQVFMADMAYDLARNTMWQVNVGGGNCIHELDLAGLNVTGDRICPDFALSQRGLAYNVKTDTFYAGSWNDSTIYEFGRDGIVRRSVDVGLPVSGLAFNPVTDHLFAMNNTDFPFQVAVLDVLDNFNPLFAFAIPGFSANGGAGLAMDNQGYLWTADKNTATVFQIDSGEPTGSLDIPWLTVTPAKGTVAGKGTQSITLDFDATGLKVGDVMEGYLILYDDTPYSAQFLPVTLHVISLPLIISSSFSDVQEESVRVLSQVDPQCQNTEYYFEYGTAEGVYDQRTASIFSSSCSPITLEFLLADLAGGETYYGRFVAINGAGTTYGDTVVFTTYQFPWLLFWPIFAEAAKHRY